MNQLELFPLSETEKLAQELKKVKESSDNVRKGLFARHNNLAKMYLDLHEKYENLCSHMNLKPESKKEDLYL